MRVPRTRAHIVTTSDGRRLAVDESGPADGFPVFLMHGTPGSRNGPKPRGKVLHNLGVRLITYDRPGYGGSTPKPGRAVADAAADVARIAEVLEADRFGVVGRSGGGPHALACTALLPGHVTRAVVLVSMAQPDAPDLDWFDGMNEVNVAEFAAVDADPLGLARRLADKVHQARRNPETLVVALEAEMAAADRRVVGDRAIRRLLLDTYREAFREGPRGWIDDVLALRRDWAFRLDSIERPVRLWHGADDTFAPASHTEWLARQIPRAEVLVQDGAAHFGAVEILPEMLAWLVSA